MATFARTSLAHAACDLFTNAGAAVTSLVQVFTGNGNLFRCLLDNDNAAADVYVQLFDAASTGAVTLGTTVPVASFRVPKGGQVVLDPIGPALLHCQNGLVAAVTTTRLGASTDATGANIFAWYVAN